jgi:membrane associated rhomboid family serine protease
MIPIRDSIPTRRVPVVNYLLIAVNVMVFVLMWLAGPAQESLVYQFAMIPSNYTNGVDLGDILDVFTSMFMHAGIAHIAGNMLYLWIFGDNVEDRLGHVRYLVFYLVGGGVASLAQLLTNPGSQIPTVGASGAIAAVLGAYLVLFPHSRIATFVPLGFFMRLTMVPAAIVLGFWFVMQFFSGVMSIGGPEVGGVAYWAHIGGFVVGVVTAKLLGSGRRPESPITW